MMVLCYYTYAGCYTIEVVLLWFYPSMYLLCYEQPKSSVISYSILITQYHASRSHSNKTYFTDEQRLPLKW
jgi:hypothetical protein